jgi:hypothetical protein
LAQVVDYSIATADVDFRLTTLNPKGRAMARKAKARKSTKRSSKFVVHFGALDAATRKRVAACIARTGKVTVTTNLVGQADGGTAYKQIID